MEMKRGLNSARSIALLITYRVTSVSRGVVDRARPNGEFGVMTDVMNFSQKIHICKLNIDREKIERKDSQIKVVQFEKRDFLFALGKTSKIFYHAVVTGRKCEAINFA